MFQKKIPSKNTQRALPQAVHFGTYVTAGGQNDPSLPVMEEVVQAAPILLRLARKKQLLVWCKSSTRGRYKPLHNKEADTFHLSTVLLHQGHTTEFKRKRKLTVSFITALTEIKLDE